MRATSLFLAPLLLVTLALPAWADPTGRELEDLEAHLEASLFQIAKDVADATRLGPNGAHAHLEALAVYRDLRREKMPIDQGAAGMPSPSGTGIPRNLQRANLGKEASLDQVEAQIAADEKWLAKGENNQHNADHVRDRLAALRKIRRQVADALPSRAKDLAKAGDEIMAGHSAEGSFDDIEARGRSAENALGSAATSKPATKFVDTLTELRRVQRGIASTRTLRGRLGAIVHAGDGADGDFVVLVMRTQQKGYRAAGMTAGEQTTLYVSDRYHVIWDTAARIKERSKRWMRSYVHGWCLKTGGVHHRIIRGSVTSIAKGSGLSKAEARKIAAEASKALKDAGFKHTRSGWLSHADGTSIPYTVPANVDSIRNCNEKR